MKIYLPLGSFFSSVLLFRAIPPLHSISLPCCSRRVNRCCLQRGHSKGIARLPSPPVEGRMERVIPLHSTGICSAIIRSAPCDAVRQMTCVVAHWRTTFRALSTKRQQSGIAFFSSFLHDYPDIIRHFPRLSLSTILQYTNRARSGGMQPWCAFTA